MSGNYHLINNSLVTNLESEQMGRRDDRESRSLDAEDVLVLSNEIQNPHVGDAAPGISTPVRHILDLNMHPLDLNMLPTEEEDDGQHTDHIAVLQVLENNHPSLQEEVAMTERALDSQLQLLYRLTSYFQQIGGVDSSRLSEKTITRHMQVRYYTATTTSGNEEPYICVICHGEYEADESLGGLRCGHEYHAQCINKWLLQNNNCPICRATAVVHEHVFL